jgi:hypothetical protein
MSDVQTEAAAPAETPVAADPAVAVPPQPPVDNDHVAEGAEQFPTPVTAADHPANEHLDGIEAIASHWGGDVMVNLRELVAKVRALL